MANINQLGIHELPSQQKPQPRPLPATRSVMLCRERAETGERCSEEAVTMLDGRYPVCRFHALSPTDREWLVGKLWSWARRDGFVRRGRNDE